MKRPVKNRPRHSVIDGYKVCPRCEQNKSVDQFGLKTSGKTTSYCRSCKVDYNKELRKRAEGREDVTAEVRFWAKVKKTPTCWLWQGGTGYKGYGRFAFRGRLEQAHRVSLMLLGQDLPDRAETGLVIDHICKTAACVRPEHLRVVTQEDNCGALARPTPFFTNKHKTHCTKGHEFTLENTAIRPIGAPERQKVQRSCLTCWPQEWRRAIIKRAPPTPRCKAWIGPPPYWCPATGKQP